MDMHMTDNAPNGRGFVTLLEAFRASGGTAPGDTVARLLEDHHRGEGRAGLTGVDVNT